jgi:hypothetical protein
LLELSCDCVINFWFIMFWVSVQNYCQHSSQCCNCQYKTTVNIAIKVWHNWITILYLWQVSMVKFQWFESLPLSSYVFFLLLLIPLLSLYDSAWKNTVPKDLFDAMEQQKIEDNIIVPAVQDFFEPWTTQPGYPVINVTITNGIITATQVSRSI